MSVPDTRYRERPPPGYGVGPAAAYRDGTGLAWPWLFLGTVLTPVLFFMTSTAILGGAAEPSAAPAKGAQTSFGDTFRYPDGLAIFASAPIPYQPRGPLELGPRDAAVAVSFTITNGTEEPISTGTLRTSAVLNGAPAIQVAGTEPFSAQDIPPGSTLTVTKGFVVPPSSAGTFEVAVRQGLKDPVSFKGPF
jgi:hypothetical protein